MNTVLITITLALASCEKPSEKVPAAQTQPVIATLRQDVYADCHQCFADWQDPTMCTTVRFITEHPDGTDTTTDAYILGPAYPEKNRSAQGGRVATSTPSKNSAVATATFYPQKIVRNGFGTHAGPRACGG